MIHIVLQGHVLEDDVLQLTANFERGSERPLAEAIVTASYDKGYRYSEKQLNDKLNKMLTIASVR